MSPIFCVKCKKELVCVENGIIVRWNKYWCRVSDRYKCPVCDCRLLLFPVDSEGYEDASRFGEYFEIE